MKRYLRHFFKNSDYYHTCQNKLEKAKKLNFSQWRHWRVNEKFCSKFWSMPVLIKPFLVKHWQKHVFAIRHKLFFHFLFVEKLPCFHSDSQHSETSAYIRLRTFLLLDAYQKVQRRSHFLPERVQGVVRIIRRLPIQSYRFVALLVNEDVGATLDESHGRAAHHLNPHSVVTVHHTAGDLNLQRTGKPHNHKCLVL